MCFYIKFKLFSRIGTFVKFFLENANKFLENKAFCYEQTAETRIRTWVPLPEADALPLSYFGFLFKNSLFSESPM